MQSGFPPQVMGCCPMSTIIIIVVIPFYASTLRDERTSDVSRRRLHWKLTVNCTGFDGTNRSDRCQQSLLLRVALCVSLALYSTLDCWR